MILGGEDAYYQPADEPGAHPAWCWCYECRSDRVDELAEGLE